MNKKLIPAVLFSLFFMAGTAHPANWADISAKIKEKYKNYGKEIKDITIKQDQEIISGDADKPIINKMTVYKKGFKSRIETAVQVPSKDKKAKEIKTIIINDGKDIWMVSPLAGKTKLPKDDKNAQDLNEEWWNSISEKGEITGTEKISGRDCYVVKFGAKKPFAKIWVNQKDYTLRKYTGAGPKNDTVTVMLSDYRKIKGTMELPYLTEVLINDKTVSTITVKEVNINKKLDDNLFSPDELNKENKDEEGEDEEELPSVLDMSEE